jgi:hypothetical protein
LAKSSLNFRTESPYFTARNTAHREQILKGMIAENFWEIGASGHRYSRKYILDALEKRHSKPHEDVWKTRDFHCRELAESIYLLTYTLLQNNQRLTRRSTIWQSTPDGWKIVFHQGTIVEDAE